MPLNYRKNSVTCSIQYYPSTSDLDGPNVCQNIRVNLQFGGQTQYTGLVLPTHEQASDLSVNICGQSLRLAKQSKFCTQTYATGHNTSGSLGLGDLSNRCVLNTISPNLLFKNVSSANSHTLAITSSGRIYVTGDNTIGQLGIGTATGTRCSFILNCLSSSLVFNEVSVSSGASKALTNDGKLYSWGRNTVGEVGAGNFTSPCCIPTLICPSLTFCKIVSGSFHSLALTNDGKLYAWGVNTCGQVGVGSTVTCYCSPVLICNSLTFCYISAGFEHSHAITNDGKLYAWGSGAGGRLGNGGTTPVLSPTCITTALSISKISGGNNFSLLLTQDGKIYSTGVNQWGQLGLGVSCTVTPSVCNFTLINCNLNFCQIQTGSISAYSLTNDGKLYSWGYNSSGQLGLNNLTSYCVPTLVCSSKSYCSIYSFAENLFAIEGTWLSAGSP
jgi:alpha-tubulin suppressor-like RCC1 family protein